MLLEEMRGETVGVGGSVPLGVYEQVDFPVSLFERLRNRMLL
ncbi:MAG: hypothetical protein JWN14_2877 [Chthonomonadales bacterium]|nr:hypothetical protein [Chthonomonadales bacterium]